jgi:pimeloyl-ACP methyl ester carboxylesterase
MIATHATTILVHGGCHGAWCWQEVVAGLALRDVNAHAFDMPGCGDDETPRAGITLADQVAAVIAQVDAAPPGPVRLVGHSIAGWLLPSVARARSDRVVEMVFLAAAVLDRGKRGIDVTPLDRRASYFEMAAASQDNSLMVTFDAARDRFFGHLDQARARWAYAQLTPQPFEPYLGAVSIGVADVDTPRRYLAADDDRTFPMGVANGFAATAGVPLEILPGDHCLMLSAPSVVVDALT